MRWTWFHTLLLLVVFLVITWLIWEATGLLLFVILFIPPIIHWKKT